MSVLTPEAPVLPPPGRPAAPWAVEPGQLLVLRDIAWGAYVAIADAIPDRPSVRITYDRGTLEVTTTSSTHEILKEWFTRVLSVLTEETGRAVVSAGQMTFRREDVARGFEPDNCYWIGNEPAVRGRTDIDLTRDPLPDLLIEIEVSRRAIARLPVYAAFRIPEVWRFDGTAIRVHRLDPDGSYREQADSPLFPEIPLAGLVRFLTPDPARDSLTWGREFRAWIREVVARGPTT